jgi:hypothetical protein
MHRLHDYNKMQGRKGSRDGRPSRTELAGRSWGLEGYNSFAGGDDVISLNTRSSMIGSHQGLSAITVHYQYNVLVILNLPLLDTPH